MTRLDDRVVAVAALGTGLFMFTFGVKESFAVWHEGDGWSVGTVNLVLMCFVFGVGAIVMAYWKWFQSEHGRIGYRVMSIIEIVVVLICLYILDS